MEIKRERNYGIDLFRIISMFMIVMLHVLNHGGFLSLAGLDTFKGSALMSLEVICFCSVNCFALVSGYVGFGSKHKSKGIINLCLQVLFYCFAFTLVYILGKLYLDESISKSFILLSLFPTLFQKYWYFSAYFCLFFFMPLLDFIVEKVSRNYLRTLGLFIFIVGCVCTMFTTRVFNLNEGYSLLWLAILYVLGAYVKKYNPFEKVSKSVNLLVFILVEIFTFASMFFMPYIPNVLGGGKMSSQTFLSYTSPTILVASIALLNIFVKLNIKRSIKIVKIVAPTTFGIYIIHCQPVFYDLILGGFFTRFADYNAVVTVALALLSGLVIFIGGFILEVIRKWIFNLLRVDILVGLIERCVLAIKNFIFKVFRIKDNEKIRNEELTNN